MRRYPTPQLRRKGNGVFFVRFGGRDHSLGSDEPEARRRYARKLEEWAAWRAGAEAEAERRGGRPGGAGGRAMTTAELAERLLEHYTAEGRLETARWFGKHLRRWLGVYGAAPIVELTTADPSRGVFAPPVVPLLSAFVADLSGAARYSPRTINHDATAVKRLYNHGADIGLCPAVQWRGVRRVPVPRSEPSDLSPELVRALIDRAGKSDARLVPWLELNFYALLRPSETVAVINAVHAGCELLPTARGPRRRRPDARGYGGHFVPLHEGGRLIDPRGLFELSAHKTLHKGHRRIIVLTERALESLDRAYPVWSTPSAYARACRLAGTPKAPQVMRDSAASALRALGEPEGDIDRLLGHAPPGVTASYVREAWPALHRRAGRLAL